MVIQDRLEVNRNTVVMLQLVTFISCVYNCSNSIYYIVFLSGLLIVP